MKKLNIVATIKDGFAIGMINFLSLVLTAVLYVVTIWIPYLNVGTTIAMASLPAELAKGNVVNPLFIFDGKYRKNMGEFFILMALMGGAIGVGFFFGIIPGIVLSIAWSFAAVLFVDKNRNALEALRESNELTYGNKWRIFGAEFLVVLAMEIVMAILGAIFGIGDVSFLKAIGTIINIAIALCIVPIVYGVEASIYKQLTSGEVIEDAPMPNIPGVTPKAEPAPAPEAPKAEEPKAEEPKVEAPKAKAPKAE